MPISAGAQRPMATARPGGTVAIFRYVAIVAYVISGGSRLVQGAVAPA